MIGESPRESATPKLESQYECRKEVAAIVTTYYPDSHADVTVTKLLEGYEYAGQWRRPRLRVVSMFTDQVPENDLSREMAARHNVAIYPTVEQSLCLGTNQLAVDGVFLIGEHGDYPLNAKGQRLYPRYRLFREIVEVYRRCGRSVPTFNDKHFSVDWAEAKWMFDQSQQLGFALLAGSSIPLAWRRPELEFALDSPIKKAVAVGNGPTESYGFHNLENLQAMVERRAGGETGLAAVQCLEGQAVWDWTDQTPWAAELLETLDANLDHMHEGQARANAASPYLFLLDYASGLQAVAYGLNDHIQDFAVAALTEHSSPIYTASVQQHCRPWGHFCGLVHFMEELVLTRRAAYPAARTLLTTGALAALMESRHQGGTRIATPHLKIAYRAPEQSLFNRGPLLLGAGKE